MEMINDELFSLNLSRVLPERTVVGGSHLQSQVEFLSSGGIYVW